MQITGYPETCLSRSVNNDLYLFQDASSHFFIKTSNNKLFRCGHFQAKPLSDLENTWKSLAHPGKGSFSLFKGQGTRTKKGFFLIDIGAQQAAPENCGATFQIASNFNCLEFVNNQDSAKNGITKYIYDKTQGPEASISAAPATLLRNYFLPEINLLDYFDGNNKIPHIPVINGYISLSKNNVATLSVKTLKKYADWIKIGIHSSVQVTTGLCKNNMLTICKNPQQQVNQIFTATIDLGRTSGSTHWKLMQKKSCTKKLEIFARMLLRAAYRGTILTAAQIAAQKENPLPGKNKVYLTMIGGGVFQNKEKWIIDSIVACKNIIQESGLNVILTLFDESKVSDKGKQRLEKLVLQTGGRVADTKIAEKVDFKPGVLM